MNGNQWYKEMSVYQIWTRSFCDGNGDGIGDLWGVYSKLDYIKSLNVDAIWFSPIYPSPDADFGYDISDYMNIHPQFGDLEIFQRVLDGAHERGLRVFMDLVVNHTSDEHFWFKEACKGRNNPYHNYYIWKDGKRSFGRRRPPNNWTSMFEGDAWEYVPEVDRYYLHLFAKKQPDLNHENPAVRNEIKKIMRFWLDMGVDGFREDVITYIAKDPRFPDAYPKLPVANGYKYYSSQPRCHDFLSEYKREVLDAYDCYTIGECPLLSAEEALPYVEEGPDQVLDQIIGFEHMTADCFMLDAIQTPFSLKKMKKAFSSWQTTLEGKAWPSLYIENHDHPRIISRYGSEKYRAESGKMLAAMYILQKGTPYIYQGQEIGMLNLRLSDHKMYRDIQAKNWADITSKILPKKRVLKLVQDSTRDSARSPMQWTSGKFAGFSENVPWFFVNENYKTINVEAEEQNPDSILNFYRKLLAFRKEDKAAMYGTYKEYYEDSDQLYVYERVYEQERLLVICSFTSAQVRFEPPEGYELKKGELVLSNYKYNVSIINGFTTRPYEMRVYRFEQ